MGCIGLSGVISLERYCEYDNGQASLRFFYRANQVVRTTLKRPSENTARDFVSAVNLWHKQAVKISYNKCRIATFTRLRTSTVHTHAL